MEGFIIKVSIKFQTTLCYYSGMTFHKSLTALFLIFIFIDKNKNILHPMDNVDYQKDTTRWLYITKKQEY